MKHTDNLSTTQNESMLTYALDSEGHLVYIDNVPNGVECGCKCPKCHESLIARNSGKIRKHHFSHASEADCVGAYETALHLLAKDIVMKEKSLMIPPYLFKKNARVLHFETVEDEVWVRDIQRRPDLVCTTSEGAVIYVEIKNTHKVDEEKECQIIIRERDCIEIDISDVELDEEKLRLFILSSYENRDWVYLSQHSEFLLYHVEISDILSYSSFHHDYLIVDSFYDYSPVKSVVLKAIEDKIRTPIFYDNWRTVDIEQWNYAFHLLFHFKAVNLFSRIFARDFFIVKLVRKDYYNLGFEGIVPFFQMVKYLAENDVINVDQEIVRFQNAIVHSRKIINDNLDDNGVECRRLLQLSMFVLLLRIWPEVKECTQDYLLFEKKQWFITMCICLTFNRVLYHNKYTLEHLCEKVLKYDLKCSFLFVRIAKTINNQQLLGSEEFINLEEEGKKCLIDHSLDSLFSKIFPRFYPDSFFLAMKESEIPY